MTSSPWRRSRLSHKVMPVRTTSKAPPPPTNWASTGSLTQGRIYPTLTLLPAGAATPRI